MQLGTTATGFILRIGTGSGPWGEVVPEIYGPLQDRELTLHEHGGVTLLVLGHCLLDAASRSARLAEAVESADLSRVAGWPGSYTAVVLQRESVIAYQDLAGQFPLYYSRLNGEILLSSDPGLLAFRHNRCPDPVTAAARIACPTVLPVWSERSPYSDVHRLSGGALLQADQAGIHVSPAEVSCSSGPEAFTDAADMLRAALIDALKDRCETQPVSADFSGGVDSTVLAYIAARHSSYAVSAITYHQPLAPAEDIAYAERFAELNPHISLSVARGSVLTLPFAWLSEAMREGTQLPETVAWSPEPTPGVLAASRSNLRLAAASNSGARLHLTGEGGDALLLAAPSYLADLARMRTVRRLLRHCGAYARMRYSSPAVLAAKSFVLASLSAPRALKRVAVELQQGASTPGSWTDAISWWPPCGEATSWLTSGIRQRLADIAGDPETASAIPEGATPADLAALTDLRRSAEAQLHLRELGRRLFGLAVHAPFLDSAVIRAATSIPAAERADPWSYKPLLRAAVTTMVPTEVLARRTKGDYSAEAYCGMRNAVGAVRELLRDSRLAAIGVLEPGAVLETVNRMAAGVEVPLGPLETVLATEVWLRTNTTIRAGAPPTC